MSSNAEVIVISRHGAEATDMVDLISLHHVVLATPLDGFEPDAHPDCHLYIIDVALAAPDNVQRIQRLLDDPGFAATARIFLLDTHSRRDIAKVHELGGADYFVRPVPEPEFIKLMGRLVTSSVETSWNKLSDTQRSALRMSLKSFEDCFGAVRTGSPPPIEGIKESSRMVVDAIGQDGLDTCMKAVRSHHNYTFRHSMFVSGILVSFGYAVGAHGEDLKKLALGGMLHDIGKGRIPLDVLDKQSKLDDDEWVIMRNHPRHSDTIFETMDGLDPDIIAMGVKHHEKLDGTGYPDGIGADGLSDLVRMTAIVDVYSALVDKRSYKPAFTNEKSVGILESMKGHLDLDLVAVFRKLMLD